MSSNCPYLHTDCRDPACRAGNSVISSIQNKALTIFQRLSGFGAEEAKERFLALSQKKVFKPAISSQLAK